MHCPLCAVALRPVERLGVEIDHCPECGGLWLDRGELDEMVRREAQRALTEGQRVLHRERRSREYDRVSDLTDAPGVALLAI